jgi:hypothetical protein
MLSNSVDNYTLSNDEQAALDVLEQMIKNPEKHEKIKKTLENPKLLILLKFIKKSPSFKEFCEKQNDTWAAWLKKEGHPWDPIILSNGKSISVFDLYIGIRAFGEFIGEKKKKDDFDGKQMMFWLNISCNRGWFQGLENRMLLTLKLAETSDITQQLPQFFEDAKNLNGYLSVGYLRAAYLLFLMIGHCTDQSISKKLLYTAAENLFCAKELIKSSLQQDEILTNLIAQGKTLEQAFGFSLEEVESLIVKPLSPEIRINLEDRAKQAISSFIESYTKSASL